jgi:hypothetical protein
MVVTEQRRATVIGSVRGVASCQTTGTGDRESEGTGKRGSTEQITGQGTDHRRSGSNARPSRRKLSSFVIDQGAFSLRNIATRYIQEIVREHANRSAVEAVYASICAVCAACSSSGSEGQRSPEFAHPPPVAIEVCTREMWVWVCDGAHAHCAKAIGHSRPWVTVPLISPLGLRRNNFIRYVPGSSNSVILGH